MIGALVVPWPPQQTAATKQQVPTATGEKPALVPSQPPTRVIGQVFHKLIGGSLCLETNSFRLFPIFFDNLADVHVESSTHEPQTDDTV